MPAVRLGRGPVGFTCWRVYISGNVGRLFFGSFPAVIAYALMLIPVRTDHERPTATGLSRLPDARAGDAH